MADTPRARQVQKVLEMFERYKITDGQGIVVTSDGGVRLAEPEQRVCRGCGEDFETTTVQTGSKWTNLCFSCLRMET